MTHGPEPYQTQGYPGAVPSGPVPPGPPPPGPLPQGGWSSDPMPPSYGPPPADPVDQIEQVAVRYDPAPSFNRISRYKRMLRGRLIGLGLSVAIATALTVWQHDRLTVAATVVLWVLVLGSGLGWLGATFWLYRRALGAVATLGQGLAMRIARPGLELAGRRVSWSRVQSLATVKGPLALGPRLRLTELDGTATTVALDQLDIRPATLDSTVRAYSNGRHGVDLEALEA